MTLDAKFLEYPRRRYGMDHDRYAWSMLERRPPVRWPGGAPLAVWINVSLEHFPLDARGAGFKAPGSMTMPYPDLRHYTLRDYGNRVGVHRVLQALKRYGLAASFAVNGELALRYPPLLQAIAATGGELVAHGWNMDCLHYGGPGEDTERETAERAWIADTLAALAPYAREPVRGWLSPARSESARTPELVREAGLAWLADWVNDELPYRFETAAGPLAALPLSLELEDRFIVTENLHSEAEYADQICDAFELLVAEARALDAGRLLALNIHPWVMGQPHRIAHLERVLAHLAAHRGAIWNAAPSAIVDHAGAV